jgi:hypothetical protein
VYDALKEVERLILIESTVTSATPGSTLIIAISALATTGNCCQVVVLVKEGQRLLQLAFWHGADALALDGTRFFKPKGFNQCLKRRNGPFLLFPTSRTGASVRHGETTGVPASRYRWYAFVWTRPLSILAEWAGVGRIDPCVVQRVARS